MEGKNAMDRLDVRLIALLQKDGTLTNAVMARSVVPPVSEETVRRRLKKLMQDKYIKVIAVPDARKIGYESQVLIGLQVDADKVDSVADALADMTEVSWVSVTTGSYDIFVWATLKSADALSEFLRMRVGKTRGVRKMETFISLGFRKQEYGLNMEAVTV